MWRYVTSFCVFLCCTNAFSQNAEAPSVATDSTQYKETYGLRVGVDLASLIRTGFDKEYSGFQILSDYRLTDRWYLAAELGNEQLERETNQIDFETSGSYVKAGGDYNFYRNWLDMDNMIYVGLRVGAANFSQTLNRYNYYQDNELYDQVTVFPNEKTTGLIVIWGEVQTGLKVEVLNNVYMNINVQLKVMASEDAPENFGNLYVPGFGRTYDTNNIGVGYSYGISYRIPFYKK
ncbi:DUF6048 family protein [Nonlabens antarcticus]|uniref:DUF6048 family protein n=1 Tax=Nonlabens antarcticus TaxID=392714 RepID=UPI001890CD2A|nr:DUF6048 family protein [Nonlabens antarcticus]